MKRQQLIERMVEFGLFYTIEHAEAFVSNMERSGEVRRKESYRDQKTKAFKGVSVTFGWKVLKNHTRKYFFWSNLPTLRALRRKALRA